MAIDPTISLSNIMDSIKRYFIDGLYTEDGVQLSFDKTLSSPSLQGTSVDRWVGVRFGNIEMDSLSSLSLDLFLFTRRDPEYFRLAELRDIVFNYLVDYGQTDSMARIPLRESSPVAEWGVLSGGFVVQRIIEGGQMELDDLTKVKQITCILRWGAKI